MREILYRLKICGKWAYGLPCKIRKDTVAFDGVFADGQSVYDAFANKETLSEFTGLTDKNGNKIFKGDIVKYSDEECYYPEEYAEFVGEIVFEKGAFGIGSREELPIDLDYWCDNDNFVSLWELYWNLNCTLDELPMLEVIGNIYDTPELLEK